MSSVNKELDTFSTTNPPNTTSNLPVIPSTSSVNSQTSAFSNNGTTPTQYKPSMASSPENQPIIIGSVGSQSSTDQSMGISSNGKRESSSSIANSGLVLVDPLKAEVQRIVEKNKNKNLFGKAGEKKGPNKEQVWSCLKSLRITTLVILTFMFTIMILAFVVIIGTILPINFGQLEKHDSLNASRRMMKVLYDDLNMNLVNLLPFSSWTVPYELFLNYGKNLVSKTEVDEYMDSNFPKAIMKSSKVNWVVYYFKNGTVAVPRTMDFETGAISTSVSSLPTFLQTLSVSHPLMKNIDSPNTRNGGFFDYNSQLIMISSSPLTLGDYTDQSDTSGVLVFGRIMSSSFINSLANSAQLCCSFHLLSETSDLVVSTYSKQIASVNGTYVFQTTADWANLDVFTYDVLTSDASLSKRQCWKTNGTVLNEQRFSSFELLNDIYGNKLMIVRTDIARDVYLLGIQSVLLSIGLLIIVCAIASMIVIMFIERRVLSRLSSLTTQIQRITASNDSKQRVSASNSKKGTDELGTVSKNINYMLDSLDILLEQQIQEQELLKKLLERISVAEERTTSIMNSIKDIVLTVTPDGFISHANTAFYERFGYSVVDVEGNTKMPLDKIFPQLKESVKAGEGLSQVISSYDDLMSHPFTGLTKKRKNIDFDAYITKSKMSSGDQHMFVFVGRISSQMLGSSITKSSSLFSMDNEFDRLILNPEEKEKFKQFCKSEKSEENMLFLEAVLEYKSFKHTHERMIKQEYIIQTFLMEEKSALPINIAGQTVKKEMSVISKGVGQLDLFDKLFNSVKNNLALDTFSRYKIQQHNLQYL